MVRIPKGSNKRIVKKDSEGTKIYFSPVSEGIKMYFSHDSEGITSDNVFLAPNYEIANERLCSVYVQEVVVLAFRLFVSSVSRLSCFCLISG